MPRSRGINGGYFTFCFKRSGLFRRKLTTPDNLRTSSFLRRHQEALSLPVRSTAGVIATMLTSSALHSTLVLGYR